MTIAFLNSQQGIRPGLLVGCAFLISLSTLAGEQTPVRYKEGVEHGFLVLHNLEGKVLADGEMTQQAEGDLITGHVVFKFNDGSLYDDTSVFSQAGHFRLLNDHL